MRRYYNGLRTAVLLGALSALILLAGQWLAGSTGLTVAAGIALATNAVAYFFSDRIALRAMRAVPVTQFEAPYLHRIVWELSAAAGQPMPRLYVSPTSAPNAFATGRNPRHAAVCVTEGLLRLLDERELRAVLGHELSSLMIANPLRGDGLTRLFSTHPPVEERVARLQAMGGALV